MKNTIQLLFLMIVINIFSQDISSPKPITKFYNTATDEFVNFDNTYEVALGCGIESVQIKAEWTEIGSPDSYRIEAIPYNPKAYLSTMGSTVVDPVVGEKNDLTDDNYSDIRMLSSNGADLNFCFFGNQRNQFVISSNGVLSFDTSYASSYSDWTIQTMGKISPNANCANDADENKDVIMQQHDTNIMDSDALFDSYFFWDILGDIGQRYFIMGTHHMPMYFCGGDNGYATHQMVFYETTNIIEFHIQDKPICFSPSGSGNSWAEGYMAMGIQNANRTIGYAVPGRDNLDQFQILDLTDGFFDTNYNAEFPVSNPESWRFVPDGVNGIAPEFGWYINWDSATNTGTLVSADPILDVSQDDVPTISDVVYTAVVKYTEYCSGSEYYATSNVTFSNEDTIEMHLQEQNSTDDTVEFIETEERNLCTTSDYTLTAIIQNIDSSETNNLEWTVESSGNPPTIVQTNTITENGNIDYSITADNLTAGVTYTFTSTITSGSCVFSDTILIHALDNIPSPEGDSLIYLCVNDSTLADLPVFNTSEYDEIYWYNTEIQEIGAELPQTTTLVDGATYYAFQSHENCAQSLEVLVNNIDIIPYPIGETEQYFFNENTPTFADIIIFNTDNFTNIYWFSSPYQYTPISPAEPLVEGTYYAFQGLGDCSDALAVNIHLIDLDGDEDNDTITNGDEDTNNDGIPNNEDTDGDNIPDFLDNDDDGDNVSTSIEAVIIDDGDGVLTINEDYDGDGNPVNDDTNNDDIPDYLQQSVALSTSNTNINLFSVYPNPVKDILNLQFKNNSNKTTVIIYNAFGSLVYKNNFYQKKNIDINISELNTGIYFINTQVDDKINTKKFIKL